MGLVKRFLNYLDDQAGHALDRHLELALPSQRRSVTPDRVTPDEVVARFLPSRFQVEQVGTFPCCECCAAYDPQPCPVVHRSPCDKTECVQGWPA